MTRPKIPAYFASRFRRLLADANKAGVGLIASGHGFVAFAPLAEIEAADDVRQLGEQVFVDAACDGPGEPDQEYGANPASRCPSLFAMRFRKLRTTANESGIGFIADASGGVAFAPLAVIEGAKDLRQHLGVSVRVNGGCDGSLGDKTGRGAWM